jgi:hypothetical protein
MHQPTEPRKYQLFPAKDKLSITAGQKNGEAETTQSTGQNGTNEKDRPTIGSALRLKPKEQTLIRRRKVSVPELGPMTTVQEIAMDSREYLRQQKRFGVKLIIYLYQPQYQAAHLCTSDLSVHPGMAGGSMFLVRACYRAYPDLHWMRMLKWLYWIMAIHRAKRHPPLHQIPRRQTILDPGPRNNSPDHLNHWRRLLFLKHLNHSLNVFPERILILVSGLGVHPLRSHQSQQE